jgi:RecF/RecN/SMC N terminal domain
MRWKDFGFSRSVIFLVYSILFLQPLLGAVPSFEVQAVTPAQAPPGAPVDVELQVTGELDPRKAVVTFDGVEARMIQVPEGGDRLTVLRVEVPRQLRPGAVMLAVHLGNVQSRPQAFLIAEESLLSILSSIWSSIAMKVVFFSMGIYLLRDFWYKFYRKRWEKLFSVIKHRVESSAISLELRRRRVVAMRSAEENPGKPQRIILEQVEIRNFKNIEHLSLDFSKQSTLEGEWICIAGVNGLGKSSILQAICFVVLGEDLVTELGRERIKRMLRRSGNSIFEAEITARVREGEAHHTLYLPLSEKGINVEKLYGHPEYESMVGLWERFHRQVFVSYGATRNLSDHKDTRYANLSREVQRQMTLFDPLSQIASVDVLLEGGGGG